MALSPKKGFFSCCFFFFCGFLTSTGIRFYFSPKDRSIISSFLSLKLPFKTLAVFPCSLYFQTRGPAASKTLGAGQRRPLSISTPNQQASLFMRACYCWAAFRNKRKLKSSAVWRHPELSGVGGREGGWGGMKGRNSCHSLLVFSRFLKRQLPRPCEWSERREGKLKRAAGGREPHSWEDTSPTHTTEMLGFSV